MESINSKRVFKHNSADPDPEGDYVLYWMQVSRRFHYNFALEYAVGWSNKLGIPLVILETLSCDYPWASDRSHTFIMQGMKEHLEYAGRRNLNYICFPEDKPGQFEALLKKLSSKAAVLVTDQYPVHLVKQRNRRLSGKLKLPYFTVDSNGLIPLDLTDKAPYSAYFFRKIVQRYFLNAYTHPPEKNPLEDIQVKKNIAGSFPADRVPAESEIRDRFISISSFVSGLDIDHKVHPVAFCGTRSEGLEMLNRFIHDGLLEYDEKRNDPDENKTSRLSPWLHFGKISEYEIVDSVLNHQPEGWNLDKITFNRGSTEGFFNGNPNIDSFLDQVITWREVGFHFAHHTPDYDRYKSLPKWARKTLDKHRDDPREWIYSLDEFAQSNTHDEIWNAAQTQLREEGMIHNYLRMLWGKKILEWTPDPETALEIIIELNNRYAIDGCDPNSYSGIFWCLGRFDRAWQERPVYGKVRYMKIENTRKKVKLTDYLNRYGSSNAG